MVRSCCGTQGRKAGKTGTPSRVLSTVAGNDPARDGRSQDGRQCHADPQLWSTGAKLNIAVLGDGFAAADQTAYNTKVQDCLDGVRAGLLLRGQVAYNIFRVNLISAQSGQPARLQREHPVRRAGRHDRLDDDQEHRPRLHLLRLVGALLARRRRRHRPEGAGRARHVGAGLRPRRRHPQRGRLRRLRRRRVPDRHARVELGGHGARVRPRHREPRRRVLRAAGLLHGRRAGSAQPHHQHEPGDAQVAAVRQPGDTGPDGKPAPAPTTTRRRSPRAGATPTTPASSRAAAPGRSASTGRRSTAGCAATRRRTARSATRG